MVTKSNRSVVLRLNPFSSGWGIAHHAVRQIHSADEHDQAAAQLLERCAGDVTGLTATQVADAAQEGNSIALQTLRSASSTLGWAIAQMATLLAPELVVIGGGVSLMPPSLFMQPVCEAMDQFVFPPLRGHVRIAPAALGEEVVVHGAILLAKQASPS